MNVTNQEQAIHERISRLWRQLKQIDRENDLQENDVIFDLFANKLSILFLQLEVINAADPEQTYFVGRTKDIEFSLN